MGVLPPSSMSSPDSHLMYDRQTRLPGWGDDGQQRLVNARVLVVGAGGLGCPALEFLARAGIGQISIVDSDRVELSNLGRQSLYIPADVGTSKANQAATRLRQINPWIEVIAHDCRLDPDNVAPLIHNQSLIIDGSDNFTTKYLLHDSCQAQGIPLVMASLYQWEAQLMVFPFHQGGPGCLRCLYPEAPPDGCVGTCAEVGVAGALTGMVGSAQALAAIRLLLDLPGQPALSVLLWDADGSTRSIRWDANPHCPCCSSIPVKINPAPPRLSLVRQVDEKTWDQLSHSERSLIIDIREEDEVHDHDWQEIIAAGSSVIHYPWSLWASRPPSFDPGRSYLVSCAHGLRSRAAVLRYGPDCTARLISLKGGYEAIRAKSTYHIDS